MNTHEIILLVGHGSRHAPGNEEILRFAGLWRQRHPEQDIEVCFIELAEPLLDAGLDSAAAKAERVIVVPLILNAAAHVKMEIPEYLEQARTRHPKTEFIYARHLGANEQVLRILKRNLRKTLLEMDAPDPRNTGVIILGRGSSDRIANGEVAKMARWLYEESEHDLVDIAFTGITHPRLETVVKRQMLQGMAQISILPYYLFTGTLMERIKRQIMHLRTQYPQLRFGCAGYTGFEDEIFELLDQRVAEARGDGYETRMMECDGCQYRSGAEAHGHGRAHHH